jgi:hypothetical protein
VTFAPTRLRGQVAVWAPTGPHGMVKFLAGIAIDRPDGLDPLLTIQLRGRKGGQAREAAGTEIPQTEGICRRGVTAGGRAYPRSCSLSVPSPLAST